MTKRSLFLPLIAALGVLAACSGSNTDETADTDDGDASATTSSSGSTGTSSGSTSDAGLDTDPEIETTIVLGDTITLEGDATGVVITEEGVTVSRGGAIAVRGAAVNRVITVDAAGQDVTLVLQGATLENTGTPAILFLAANKAGIVVRAGTENYLAGGNDEYDAALFSKPSLTLDGEGTLHVDGNFQEGIASEMHLDIVGANTWITSTDDGLNANNDGVSIITIHGGFLHIEAGGDGIDSNGSIVIDGGTVITSSIASSDPNTGLDADLGVAINGGTVVATGASGPGGGGGPGGGSSEPVSSQPRLTVNGAAVGSNELVVATDAMGSAVLAFRGAQSYQQLVVSAPALTAGASYTLYRGGTVEGTETGGLYTNVSSFTLGTVIGSATAE